MLDDAELDEMEKRAKAALGTFSQYEREETSRDVPRLCTEIRRLRIENERLVAIARSAMSNGAVLRLPE